MVKFFPVNASFIDDNRYNDLLFADFTNSYRDMFNKFHVHYLNAINRFDREIFIDNDTLSYDIFRHNTQMSLEGFKYKCYCLCRRMVALYRKHGRGIGVLQRSLPVYETFRQGNTTCSAFGYRCWYAFTHKVGELKIKEAIS